MPERTTVLLIGGDLMARARLESAARAVGAELVTAAHDRLESALEEHRASIVVVDLDGGGERALAALQRARARGLLPERVVGYFSHVDAQLGEAARAAGCETFPRGRFWRSLADILGAPG